MFALVCNSVPDTLRLIFVARNTSYTCQYQFAQCSFISICVSSCRSRKPIICIQYILNFHSFIIDCWLTIYDIFMYMTCERINHFIGNTLSMHMHIKLLIAKYYHSLFYWHCFLGYRERLTSLALLIAKYYHGLFYWHFFLGYKERLTS